MAHTSHVVATTEELLEAVYSVRSVPRLYKGVRFQPGTDWSETVRSLRLVSSEVGVRRSPACKDVSPEVEERPLPRNVTENTGLYVTVICKV
jgi:hypothetical protein